jgi:AmmeMemoRadiSam system protein B
MTEVPTGNADPKSGKGRSSLGPTVAGTWYTDEPVALARQIDGFLADVPEMKEHGGNVRALIAPHAGFAYSGAVAGHGFASLRDQRFERVVLLGPSHHAGFPGAAAPAADVYRTPLGEVDLDTEAIATLGNLPEYRIDDSPFRPEHCLEAEILFLQRILAADWVLLPLLIGAGGSPRVAENLAAGLKTWITPETLIVVSSDFTHFGPRFRYVPFHDDVPQRIEQLDMGAVEHILAGDTRGFTDYVERTGATICGRDPIGILLRLLPGEFEATLAAYDTSGRMTGDWDHSVSYASLIFRERRSETAAT